MSAATRASRLERRKAALAAWVSMSPPGPTPERLRVATWNLNSLRARVDAVDRFLEQAAPDVLCLQETWAAHLSDEAMAGWSGRATRRCTWGSRLQRRGGGGTASIGDVRSSGDLGDEHLDR